MSDLRPPEDGHPFPASLHRRQHEVQAVAGRAGCLAAAWTDDTMTSGTSGWTCGFSVSLDRGRSWSPPLFRKHPDFAVTGNPTIAINASGAVFAISMAVDADYRRGVLECACSTDSGASWTPWRTVVSRDHGIPDRPKLLAAASGDLHLVFAAVEPTGRMWKALRSTIQHMTSPDRGQTWSAPRELSVEPRRSRWLIDGFQGPAIAEASRGELLVSWADYYGNTVSVSTSRGGGRDFEPPIRVKLKTIPGTNLRSLLLGVTFGTPVTELAVDTSGRNVAMSVHEAHVMGEILLVISENGGVDWHRGTRLTTIGTNASIQFDGIGRLHAIWTELRDGRVDVRYATSNDGGQTMSASISLSGNGARVQLPRSGEEREECEAALGSYQSLLVSSDGAAAAFWIDLRNGLSRPRLYQSMWRV